MQDALTKLRAHAELFDIPGQAVIATTVDGSIVYWSDAATRLYGWAETEAIGRNIVDVTPANASREQADEIMDALRHGRTWSGEFNVRARSGREFRAFVRDVPVHGTDGELVGIVGISRKARAPTQEGV